MFAYCVNNPIHYVDPNGSAHMCRTTTGICPVCGRNLPWNRWPRPKSPQVEADYTATTPSGVEVSIYVDESKARQADGGKKSVRAVDKRKTGGKNPNIQVIDSYKIVNPTIQYEIIDVLLEYDKKNPNDPAWGRTREKMKIEWDMHNLGYYGASVLNLDDIKERAQDVDFDYNDEETKFYEYFFK